MSSVNLSKSVCVAGLFVLVGCGGGSDMPQAGEQTSWNEAFPEFTKHTIAEFDGGYYGTAFDVDGDGMRDILALSTGGSELVWFKNPTWDKHVITTGTTGFIHMAPYDIDEDGDLDLAIASEFALSNSTSGGMVHWVENPEDPVANQEWNLHYIDAIPTSHRLRWGDIDGDGTRELLNLPIIGVGVTGPEYVGASQLKAYWIPDDPTGTWDAQVLDDSHLEVAHGFSVVDWDGDAAEDILTAANDGVMLFRPGLGGPPVHIGAGLDAPRPNRGSSEVSMGSLGGQRFVATIDPWHGTDAVIYTPGMAEGELWTRTVVGTAFEGGHALIAADLNGDGYDEVVGGGRGGDRALMIYRYIPGTDSWEEIPLDVGGVAVSGLDISDVNGDGSLDIVAIGGATDNVVLYENSF